MGRTWPNLEAETVVEPGYYWNAKLKKLARLGLGEKLPRGVGPWEMVAPEGQLSSSQVARILFDRYPNMDVNEFTYTTTSPLPRRLPMGDRPKVPTALVITLGVCGAIAVGTALGWWLAARRKEKETWLTVRERREKPLRRAMLEKELRSAVS